MALSVLNVQTSAFQSSGDVVVTKPTGLAAGDLMVAIGASIGASTPTWATPSGWNLVTSITDTSGGDAILVLWYKVADSSDASASNFNLGQPNINQDEYSASIYGITGQSGSPVGSNNTAKQNSSGSSGTLTYSIGFTPDANSLLIFTVAKVSSDADFSGYVIATDNPSWTEQFELDVDGGSQNNTMSYASASAVRAAGTSTGDWSVDWSGTFDNTPVFAISLAINPGAGENAMMWGANF